MVDNFRHFDTNNSETVSEDTGAVEGEASVGKTDLVQLSDQWLGLLRSGKHSDVSVQCRDERMIRCHSLVMRVRCPGVLEHAVREDDHKYILIVDSTPKLSITSLNTKLIRTYN